MGKIKTVSSSYALRRRRALVAAEVDALLISRPEDVGYLTGFTGADSFLLVGRRFASLITDGRYAEQAEAECPDVETYVRSGSMPQAVARLLKGRGVRRLGLQADHMTLRGRQRLAATVNPRRLRAISDVLGELRAVKDAGEVKAVRKAVRAAERALGGLLAGGAKALEGRTERQVAAELEYRMRLGGADCAAFETVVAAGAHSALPHYRPGTTKIRGAQAVLIDFGARLGDYCSDLTRVVFIGKIPPKLADVYEVVRRAQAAGIAALRAGLSGRSVDAAARKVIAAAGYADRFVHSLGHGIGRQVHELPALARTSGARLRAGMIVTVEPGIYLPGIGGIRIEDDILITRTGRQRLSSLPRALKAVVLR